MLKPLQQAKQTTRLKGSALNSVDLVVLSCVHFPVSAQAHSPASVETLVANDSQDLQSHRNLLGFESLSLLVTGFSRDAADCCPGRATAAPTWHPSDRELDAIKRLVPVGLPSVAGAWCC